MWRGGVGHACQLSCMILTYEVIRDIHGPGFETKRKLESVLTSGRLFYWPLGLSNRREFAGIL
jgi:hypothetical protein